MGFWIFMFCLDLLIPAIMIVLGALFMKGAPKKINYTYGYRTAMSMKNRDTWEFAHRHCGKLWFATGLIESIPSALAMILIVNRGEAIVSIVGVVICLLQTALILVLGIPTERALKKNFDKDGNRITK